MALRRDGDQRWSIVLVALDALGLVVSIRDGWTAENRSLSPLSGFWYVALIQRLFHSQRCKVRKCVSRISSRYLGAGSSGEIRKA